jgi:hypothetical protein
MIHLNRIFESEDLDLEIEDEDTPFIKGGENEDLDELEDEDFNEETFEENFDPSLIEELIDLVGSEEEVEEAAELCYNELMDAFQNNEVELEDEDTLPETLAFSALVIKLVELGKLDPQDAEDFLQDYFG